MACSAAWHGAAVSGGHRGEKLMAMVAGGRRQYLVMKYLGSWQRHQLCRNDLWRNQRNLSVTAGNVCHGISGEAASMAAAAKA